MVVLVVGILVALALVQAAIWIPLTQRWRRQAKEFDVDLQQEMALSGERFVVAPEDAVYRGGSGHYSAVKGNGSMMLTDRRLLFRKRSGGLVDVPLSDIVSTHRSAGFQGSRVGGATHLVVVTSDPAEVGFFVKDLDAWERALA